MSDAKEHAVQAAKDLLIYGTIDLTSRFAHAQAEALEHEANDLSEKAQYLNGSRRVHWREVADRLRAKADKLKRDNP